MTYFYTISSTATGRVDAIRLIREIKLNAIIVTVLQEVAINADADSLAITFAAVLTAPEIAALDVVVAAHNGRTDRPVWGRIDTTVPTILAGTGFTIAKNGVGDVTITFPAGYTAGPCVCGNAEDIATATGLIIDPPVAGSVRVVRLGIGGLAADGSFSFYAFGLQ